MSKAEEKALEAYPHYTAENLDDVIKARKFFAKGYEQAEKDLALTWEDIKNIGDLCMEVATLFAMVGKNKDIMEQPFYEEIAKRFNNQRKK